MPAEVVALLEPVKGVVVEFVAGAEVGAATALVATKARKIPPVTTIIFVLFLSTGGRVKKERKNHPAHAFCTCERVPTSWRINLPAFPPTLSEQKGS